MIELDDMVVIVNGRPADLITNGVKVVRLCLDPVLSRKVYRYGRAATVVPVQL